MNKNREYDLYKVCPSEAEESLQAFGIYELGQRIDIYPATKAIVWISVNRTSHDEVPVFAHVSSSQLGINPYARSWYAGYAISPHLQPRSYVEEPFNAVNAYKYAEHGPVGLLHESGRNLSPELRSLFGDHARGGGALIVDSMIANEELFPSDAHSRY